MAAADQDLNEFNSTSPVLVNYTIANSLSGTGVIDFYLAQSQSTTVLSPIGVDRIISSTKAGRDILLLNGTDRDFDFPIFNITQTLYGTVTIQCEMNSTNPLPSVTFRLNKVSGGAESTIGTAVAITLAAPGVSTKYLIEYPLTSKINFKKGDFLRLSVKSNNATATYLGTDPANETGTSVENTKTTVSLPFDLPNQ